MKLLLLVVLLLIVSLAFAKEEKEEKETVESKDTDDKKFKPVIKKIEEETDKHGITLDNKVLVLTEGNFEMALKEYELLLVEFYAPWCGHCKSLTPEYEKAAKTLLEKESIIKLAKVDATVERALATEYKIQGFPTLKFFRGGKPTDYNGPRTAEGIVEWLEKKSGPAATDVKTVDEVKKVTDSDNVVAVGFFKDQESAEAKAFTEAAGGIDEAKFLITSEKSVMDEYKVTDKSIVLFKKFDDERTDYDGKLTADDIEKWLKEEAMPLISEFNQETAPKIFGSDIKVHFLLFVSKEDKTVLDKQLAALSTVAKANKGKLVFVYLDSNEEGNSQILEYFSLTKEDCPIFIVYEMETNAKFIGEKNSQTSGDEMKKFVKNYLDGKLERTLKSDDVPEDWDKEPVKVIVGKNFKDVAMDKTKDVFVEFYAPWCGHCKSLAPVWEKLAEAFESDDSVVIAKMDSTANEVEEVQIQGFPTLKMFKKDTNEIVDYKGKRDLESLIKFAKTGEQDDGKDTKEAEDEDEEDTKEDKKKDEL